MKFVVEGGKTLQGEIEVRGAKNSVMKAMACSLLFDEPVVLENVPLIEDVFRMAELLENLGAKVEKTGERSFRLDPSAAEGTDLRKEIAKRLRASIVIAGPLLARNKKVSSPHPGGCVIGKRPIDLFLDGWRAMGANVTDGEAGFEVEAEKLKGTDFTFRVVSVTGTETLMMTAVLADGKTVLRNAAMEPEIPALAKFLNDSGAEISGAGTPTVEIVGTGGRLLRAKSPFRIIPDRIEAGSFLILGAALGRNVKIKNCNPEHLASVIATLISAGVPIGIGRDWISVSRPPKISALDVKTKEYPGFPTDLQAPITALMTQAEGESKIVETIFENRFGYIEDLKRMGANIILCDPQRILVKGPTELRGREIESPDLRAGLAFVIAALLAKGGSVVSNVYQIDRGYEKIDERLRLLGAEIKRVD
ncbi:MAG: UDP-N-acetylglucosamine 1-carboxyvinyltransferase [Candidatus Liptonbacteria bacterium]|nr:UDP-N-acetylglucosamine 1-carboxyvinyltransferase [Candidatus Liptonbacteria bacterium]